LPKHGSQLRRDVWVAVWVVFILALVVGVPFVIVTLTSNSNEEKPPPVTTPTETVASCAGPQPRTPLRDPGPFTSATDVDTNHVFVATIKTYCGNMLFKIDPKDAPDAARSFVFLARKRFYDGLTFDHIVKGLGLLAGEADPGYSVASGGAKAAANGDVVMVSDAGGRVASHFAIVTGPNFGIAGAKIGSVLENEAATFTVLSRLMAQPASSNVPSPPLYIIHIEIQEFERG
jgi:hypothetical protein